MVELRKINTPLVIIGVGGVKTDTSYFVLLNLYIRGKAGVGHFTAEFHVVENYSAGLLVRLNTLMREGINLLFSKKQAIFTHL